MCIIERRERERERERERKLACPPLDGAADALSEEAHEKPQRG